MSRDFSAVGTSSGSAYAATATRGKGGGKLSGNKWFLRGIIGLVVLAVVAVLVAMFTSGGGEDSETDAIRTAHGPTTTIDGIPRGYTRDKAGVQTAAVNFSQAHSQVYGGRIDGDKLREVAVSASATPALLEVVKNASGREEDDRGSSSNVPLVVTVTDFTENEATVSIWGMGVGQRAVSPDSDKVGILTVYSTETITMKWEDGDWKAADWEFETGPSPEEAMFPAADSPLSKQGANGFYAFYVD